MGVSGAALPKLCPRNAGAVVVGNALHRSCKPYVSSQPSCKCWEKDMGPLGRLSPLWAENLFNTQVYPLFM